MMPSSQSIKIDARLSRVVVLVMLVFGIAAAVSGTAIAQHYYNWSDEKENYYVGDAIHFNDVPKSEIDQGVFLQCEVAVRDYAQGTSMTYRPTVFLNPKQEYYLKVDCGNSVNRRKIEVRAESYTLTSLYNPGQGLHFTDIVINRVSGEIRLGDQRTFDNGKPNQVVRQIVGGSCERVEPRTCPRLATKF